MEQIKAYLESKELKVIDTSSLINDLKTYEKYTDLAEKQPKAVLYFKRNKKNEMFFRVAGASKECNYFFLNKNNYLYAVVENTIDDNLKRRINNFLELTSEISECMICCNKTQEFITCEKCSYSFCQKCGKEMIEFDKIIELKNNFKYKCPQCRQYNENLNINIR